jgi:putative zinc finger/helix-turn-helix YgiT family protein
MEKMSFPYGDRGNVVTLTADVPVWACDNCGERHTAEGAEEAERAAICAYLGRLTPHAIVTLRKSAALNQERFAKILGVGRVTLARWETGQQLQSAVYDQLIRERARTIIAPQRSHSRFRTDVEPRRAAAAAFTLILAAA